MTSPREPERAVVRHRIARSGGRRAGRGPVVTGDRRDQAHVDTAWYAVARLAGAQSAGAMLELKRKTFDGSYSLLSAASRA